MTARGDGMQPQFQAYSSVAQRLQRLTETADFVDSVAIGGEPDH
jgi:hypothetical protein